MSPFSIALIMLAVVFGGALLGLSLQKILPAHHLTPETKDVVRLATALIATLSALVLGLLISSAQDSFDRFDNELIQNAANIVTLDRALDEYGPETQDIRVLLKTDKPPVGAGSLAGIDLLNVWAVRASQCGGDRRAADVFNVRLSGGAVDSGDALTVHRAHYTVQRAHARCAAVSRALMAYQGLTRISK